MRPLRCMCRLALLVCLFSIPVWGAPFPVLPPTPADDLNFGVHAQIEGNIAVVSAHLDDVRGVDAGAVHIYRRGSTPGWSYSDTIRALDGQGGDWFGGAFALKLPYLWVGAPTHTVLNQDDGAVYRYSYDATTQTWSLDAKITRPTSGVGDNFGWSVYADGNLAMLNCPTCDEGGLDRGVLYPYWFTGGTWTAMPPLHPVDPADDDFFGRNVAINNRRILVGVPTRDETANDSGVAYVFRFQGSGSLGIIGQEQKIICGECVAGDHFGGSVALYGETAFISAPDRADRGPRTGAVYRYDLVGSTWTYRQKLLPGAIASGDSFGSHLTMSDSRLFVSAPTADVGALTDAGAVYVYERGDPNWTLVEVLSGDEAGEWFGWWTDVDGNRSIVTAPFATDVAPGGGAAIIFDTDPFPPTPTAIPTATPSPSATPSPTATPPATGTPSPSPVPTSTGTSTPSPTNTPVPTPILSEIREVCAGGTQVFFAGTPYETVFVAKRFSTLSGDPCTLVTAEVWPLRYGFPGDEVLGVTWEFAAFDAVGSLDYDLLLSFPTSAVPASSTRERMTDVAFFPGAGAWELVPGLLNPGGTSMLVLGRSELGEYVIGARDALFPEVPVGTGGALLPLIFGLSFGLWRRSGATKRL